MSSKQIKWLILTTPTLTIGLWEYLRHTILLPHLSMELGNWLSPLIIFIVTIMLLTPLFQAYERLQQELKQERESKQLMAERERIARELHDGIAQTLFLSSVQVERLKTIAPHNQWSELQHSLHHIQEYVRRSIHTLITDNQLATSAQLHTVIEKFQWDTNIPVHYTAAFQDAHFSQKEGWEIVACVKEALSNIRKHAHAKHVWLALRSTHTSWELTIEDDGQGFDEKSLESPNCFGIRMMKDRAAECDAQFSITRAHNKSIVHICKGVN